MRQLALLVLIVMLVPPIAWGIVWFGGINLVRPAILEEFMSDQQMLADLEAATQPRAFRVWFGGNILTKGCRPEVDFCFNWNDYGRVETLLAFPPDGGFSRVRILRECDGDSCTYLETLSAYLRPALPAEVTSANGALEIPDRECRSKQFALLFASYTAKFCKSSTYVDGNLATVSYSANVETVESPVTLCQVGISFIASRSHMCPELAERLGE